MSQHGKGLILDVDGTLVDSNDAHARAWAEVLGAAGFDAPVERLRRLIGMGSDKFLPAAVGLDKNTPLGKQLTERRKSMFQERYLPHLRPTRGATDLLARLRADGVPMAIASSADPEELEGLLRVVDAADLLQQTPDSDEVDASKPDPDVVQAALRRLGPSDKNAVMLGDTPYDVEAATRAGLGCIGLRCGGWEAAALAGALAVYADPADLLAHYADSPLARD